MNAPRSGIEIRVMRPFLGLREPASALTHGLGMLFAVFALIWMETLALTHGAPSRVIGFGVFGTSLVLLYLSSALYHGLNLSEKNVIRLKCVDHMMIYVFIAGTYTPVCLTALSGAWRWGLLGAVWGLAFVGIACKCFCLHAPRWLSVALYLGLGWLGVIVAPQLLRLLPSSGFVWIAMGGVFYTIGALVYGLKRPNFLTGVWEFHETWHLFVMAGSFCHVWAIGNYVLPLP